MEPGTVPGKPDMTATLARSSSGRSGQDYMAAALVEACAQVVDDVAAELLGPGGDRLNQLRAESGASISLAGRVRGCGTRELIIRGSRPAVVAAVQLLRTRYSVRVTLPPVHGSMPTCSEPALNANPPRRCFSLFAVMAGGGRLWPAAPPRATAAAVAPTAAPAPAFAASAAAASPVLAAGCAPGTPLQTVASTRDVCAAPRAGDALAGSGSHLGSSHLISSNLNRGHLNSSHLDRIHHGISKPSGRGTNKNTGGGGGGGGGCGHGHHKLPWRSSEDTALRRGVAELGFGKWAAILAGGGFHSKRTSVALKDRARTLGLKP